MFVDEGDGNIKYEHDGGTGDGGDGDLFMKVL